MKREWMVWRLVICEKVATLQEINTYWNYNQIRKANDGLNYLFDLDKAKNHKDE